MAYLSLNLINLLHKLESKLASEDSYDGINGIIEAGEGISMCEIDDLAKYGLINRFYFNFESQWHCAYSFTEKGKDYLRNH